MRKTASEILNHLEMRVARLERTASRRDPRKVGPRTLADQNEDARDLLDLAKRSGFRRAKIQFQGDNPVVVLEDNHYIFLTDKGYEIENPMGGVTFTYKFGDVKHHIQSEGGSFGGSEVGMEEMELTPTYDDIHTLLTADSGYMGERWQRHSDSLFVGGDYQMTVKPTRMGIKFSLTGPNLKRGESISEVRGMVKGGDRMEQLEALSQRLDAIAMATGKRKAKSRMRAMRALANL